MCAATTIIAPPEKHCARVISIREPDMLGRAWLKPQERTGYTLCQTDYSRE